MRMRTMKTRVTKADLEDLARRCGLSVSTWSPGDGWTRYRLHEDQGGEYFRDPYIYGGSKREVAAYLRGFADGKSEGGCVVLCALRGR